jgi:3-dehydroquinate synthase
MAPAEVLTRQERLLQKFGLPAELPKIDAEQVEALFGFMARDKKFRAGKMRFILPRRIGEVELSEEVTLDDVRKALAG